MTDRRFCFTATGLIVGMLLYAAGACFSVARAQVTTNITSDGTLGTNVTQSVPGFYDIDGGTISNSGTNQFHSFGQFTLGTGDGASFNGPAGIQNILARVTGGSLSQIDGYLTTNIPGGTPSLFLMNPAGVIFGPNSILDVQGSFHATTADYVSLAGDKFSVGTSATDAMLMVAAPTAFGFLNSSAAPIDVTANVLVPNGETLSFVGGDINLGVNNGSAPPAFLLAPGGTVNLASVASPGEVSLGSPINTNAFAQLGDINMSGGSVIDAQQVVIRSENLVIDESVILPGILALLFNDPDPTVPAFYPIPDGGGVDVKVRNNVTMSGTGPEPFTAAPPGILTYSGNFDIFAVRAPAKVPDITIEANSVTLSGYASVQTDRLGPGAAPNVVVNADTIKVENGAAFALFNFFEGPGGALTLNAQQVELSGGGVVGGAAGATGLLAQGVFHPSYFVTAIDPPLSFSDSGTINVNASQSLTMSGGAQITTDSRSFGRSDDITIQAGDIFLSDRGGQISSQSLFAGDSGNVSLTSTGSNGIQINNGFVVSANTFGTGNSGRININAATAVNISGTASGIASQTVPPPQAELDAFAALVLGPGPPAPTFADLAGALGLNPATADIFDVLGVMNSIPLTAVPGPLVPGNGGNITVTTPVLTVSGQDSAIDSSTAWDGNAGAVNLDVGALTVSNGGQIRSRSGLTEIGTGTLFVGTGNAGTINVAVSETNPITITGADSQISTATFGAGAGGDISLSSAGNIVVTDNGSVQASSFGGGDGGTISLNASELTVSNGGSIEAGGFGTGLAGNINIATSKQVVLDSGTISTEATISDGGNITINTVDLLDLLNSTIETSVQSGVGAGGNIDIDPTAVVLQNSTIVANAFGGPGGNIRIVAGQFIVDQNSLVSASSALGIAGNIEINAPDTNITGKLVPLPKNFLDASKLLRDRCGASQGNTSSFSAKGNGGVPPGPDGYLPSYAMDDTATRGAATATRDGHIEANGGQLLAMVPTQCTW